MKKQMSLTKVFAILILWLAIWLSACKTCNCPAYSYKPPVQPIPLSPMSYAG